jgi:hypothetical protein
MFFYNTDQETLLNYIQHYLLFKQNILKEKITISNWVLF